MGRFSEITFFNDWQRIAMDSAEANFQMRDLKPEDVHATNRLHAYWKMDVTLWETLIESDAVAAIAHAGKVNAILTRSNLVLIIHGKTVQPIEKYSVRNRGYTVTMGFDFDASPADLLNPVTVISIEGSRGHKHTNKLDLAGIFDVGIPL